MDRCPNCGAQIRSGARFCTTCGYRLSDTESTGSQAAAATADQTESTDTNAAAAAASDESQQPTPETETAAAGEGDPAGESGGSWPSSWGSWPSNQEQAPAANEASAGSEAAEPANAPQDSATAAEQPADTAEADTAEPAPNDSDVIELGPPDEDAESAAAATAPPAAAATQTDETPAWEPTAAHDAQDRSSLDHALSLLDQLRELLPGLAAPPATSDASAIADELAAVQAGANTGESDQFGRLRQTIASAREQPRDIETALNLVGNLDAIAALQDRYDHLTAAVDRAIERLRDQPGAG